MIDPLILELNKINEQQGVLGSLILTPDGIVVKSEVKSEFDDESISAMGSSLTDTIRKSLNKIFNESFFLYSFTAVKGEILFINMETAFLLILVSPDTTLSMIKIEAIEVAKTIKDKLKFKING
jgi:predicted regulator of Ras-like GTPase activity (Roadblock/LC7/MglB family)